MSPAFIDFLSMAAFLLVFALICGVGTVLLYRTFGYDRVVRSRLRALAPETETADGAPAEARAPLSALGAEAPALPPARRPQSRSPAPAQDRKSTRLNSSHDQIS